MSSYSELIKNFEKVRAYMRDFYKGSFALYKHLLKNTEEVNRIKQATNYQHANVEILSAGVRT